MTPDKLTFKTTVQVQVEGPRTIVQRARHRIVKEIDFTLIAWRDLPGKAQLHATLPGFPELLVLGAGAPVPYDPAWTEETARAAFLVRIGVTIDAGGTPAVVAPSVGGALAAPAPDAAAPVHPVQAA